MDHLLQSEYLGCGDMRKFYRCYQGATYVRSCRHRFDPLTYCILVGLTEGRTGEHPSIAWARYRVRCTGSTIRPTSSLRSTIITIIVTALSATSSLCIHRPTGR